MIVSATSQHAIRALVHLAKIPEGESLLGRELAERAEIPANFLSKIMLTLRNAGIVDATRGQGGGYRLLKTPNQITFLDIVDLFDGVTARPSCFLGEKHACNDDNACAVHSCWKIVCETYLQFMRTNTIGNIGLGDGCTPPVLLSPSSGRLDPL